MENSEKHIRKELVKNLNLHDVNNNNRECLKIYKNHEILKLLFELDAQKTLKCIKCPKELQKIEENFRCTGFNVSTGQLYWYAICKECLSKKEKIRPSRYKSKPKKQFKRACCVCGLFLSSKKLKMTRIDYKEFFACKNCTEIGRSLPTKELYKNKNIRAKNNLKLYRNNNEFMLAQLNKIQVVNIICKGECKESLEANFDNYRLRGFLIDNLNKPEFFWHFECKKCEKLRDLKRDKTPSPEKYLKYRAMRVIAASLHGNFSHYTKTDFLEIYQTLGYTLQDLKLHFECYFLMPGNEWMNWKNHGKYIIIEWDDNDKSTWKWQIDHIIPQSDLPYTSMEDENFKKCWALENLRPLSAKQNQLDGARKTRHK